MSLKSALKPSEIPFTFPPGHFYSPVVDTVELGRRRDRVFDRARPPANIDLREEHQLELLATFARHSGKLPFSGARSADLRYGYENPAFGAGDAAVLASMLMELRPRRVIEIGSGHSSCVTMDVNELFLDGAASITFIEPHPELLRSLMKPGDEARYPVIASPVQDVDPAIFDELQAGDVLFIDSTHVAKCGSDVNCEFFSILPRLASGVCVHFHDMFYPFEYPEDWFFKVNFSWNELYLMRAFLTHNAAYEIVFFSDFMRQQHWSETVAAMPLFAKNSGGSLWLRKR